MGNIPNLYGVLGVLCGNMSSEPPSPREVARLRRDGGSKLYTSADQNFFKIDQ